MESKPGPTETGLVPGDRHPFWNYEEVALFAGAILPSLLISAIIVRVAAAAIPSLLGDQGVQLLLGQLLIYAVLLGSIHLMFWLRHDQPMWSSLGWTLHFKGAWLYLLAAPLLAVGISALGAALNAPLLPNPVETLTDGGVSLAMIAVFAVILGPVFEELVFRGFLFPLFRRSLGTVAGILLAAVLFSLVHGQQYEWSWQILLLLTMAGAVFGIARHRSGSTAASTLMHVGYNLTLFIPELLRS